MGISVYIRKAVENGKMIFPGKYCEHCSDHANGEKLKCLECLKGSKSAHSFSSQYMNDPVDEDSVEFKTMYIQKQELTSDITALLSSTPGILSVDPAVSLGTVNDYTGLCVSKILPGNIVYILEAIQKRLTPPELIDKVFELRNIYNCTIVLFETTASQLVFLHPFKQEMIKRHEFFTIEEVGRSTKESKPMRIRAMLPFYSNGLIKHRPGLDELEYQLLQFPRNTHDDIIDALAHQVPYWKNGSVKSLIKPKTPHGSLNWWKQQHGSKSGRWHDLFGDLIK